MSVSGSCHCGAVTVEVPSPPAWVGSCNCSLCTKLRGLLAYYPENEVTIAGDTVAYIWGDRMIGIHHCPICGCFTHWRSLDGDIGRMGVNASLLDGFDPDAVEIRLFDNR
ncbi:MAG TPA: GFA family protein [Allosphingosinicella sp.]